MGLPGCLFVCLLILVLACFLFNNTTCRQHNRANMPKISSLLGDQVIRNNGEEVSTESLGGNGKVVGLYFSAHECPPCQAFRPTPENVPTPYFHIFYFFFFETTNMRCFILYQNIAGLLVV